MVDGEGLVAVELQQAPCLVHQRDKMQHHHFVQAGRLRCTLLCCCLQTCLRRSVLGRLKLLRECWVSRTSTSTGFGSSAPAHKVMRVWQMM